MISQRPTESDEDYKKRKRRVKLSMMGGLANGGGSLALAAIIYNMDTFNLDVDVRTIDNAGAESSSADAPMYASNHIFLDGSTQDVTYTTVIGSGYGYFDVATKSHVKFTASAATATITDSHSNFFSLKGGASLTELDLSLLNLNPESIARLVDGGTVAGLSFDLADIEAFYPGNEGAVETLGRVYDVTDQTFLTYSTIVNFLASCRTNLDLTNYGALNLLYKQDATGRFTGMADANLIEFTGDSRYVDVGFMPPGDSAWEIDLVMEIIGSSNFNWNGCFSTTGANMLIFGKSNANKAELYIGSAYAQSPSALSDGIHQIRIEFDGLGGGNLVVDNVTAIPFSGSSYTYSASESLFIGVTSRAKAVYSNPLERPVGVFRYTERTRTPSERDRDYASDKLKYPTLP